MALQPDLVPTIGTGLANTIVEKLPGGETYSARRKAAIYVAAAALVALAAFLTRPLGFVMVGLAFGALVAYGVPAARAAVAPILGLALALLPLGLPLVAFLAAGAVDAAPGLQVVAGVATGLLVWAMIRPDLERIPVALQGPGGGLVLRRKRVGLPLLIIVGALVVVVYGTVSYAINTDATSRLLFGVAATLLAIATVLRILGFARTWPRAATAAAALGLFWTLGASVGLLPGDGGTTGWAIAFGVCLGVTAIVEVLTSIFVPQRSRVAIALETPVVARWIADQLAVAGLALAGLSAILLLAAVITATRAGGAQEHRDGLRAGLPPTPPAQQSDPQLAATYAPVLLFTADQRLMPTTVDAYLGNATLTDWDGRTRRVQTPADLPDSCPHPISTPCFKLAQDCAQQPDPVACADALPDPKAVYVRVARRSQWAGCTPGKTCADGSPNPFTTTGDYAPDTSIIVQYWFFYPYNDWEADTAVGQLKEIHAADWEAVTVGLSDTRPLWAAYSAHCAGTYADWDDVRVAPSDPARLRPLVAVAIGSQANYRVAEEQRVPNFAECSGVKRDQLKLVSYAANIRDTTGDAQTWTPAAGDLRLVDATTPPMNFAGTWAPNASMRLDSLHKSLSLGKPGAGPASPPLQKLWRTPMKEVFGGGAWKRG
jgi:hypothetical protein